MKAFFSLLGVYFKSLLLTSLNLSRGGNKKKAATGVAAMVLLGFIMVLLSATYSFMMGALFAPVGGLDIMLMVMLLMAVAFPLFFTIFAAQSMVFSTKDLDLVLALPVSSFAVMLARVFALYLEVLLMVEFLLLPAGIAYLVFGGAGGIGFLLLLLLLGAFLALLPTLLSLVLGCIISLIVARLPLKNLFITLFSIALTGLILVGSFSINSGLEAVAADIDGVRGMFLTSMPFLGWAVQAVTGPNLLYFLLIALACAIPFFGITWLFSLFYKKTLTALSSHTAKRNYKLRGVKASSSFAALFKKEASKFFRTPGFVLNCGISALIIIGASIFAAFNKHRIGDFLASLLEIDSSASLLGWVPIILLGFIMFFLTTLYTAAISISLEGKTLWILKEAPLSTGRIFAAKAGFNFLLAGFTVLVSIPLLGYAFSMPLADVLGILLLGLLFSLLISLTGLFANLLLPRLDAENETIIIKQSASVLVSMVLNLVPMGLTILLYVFTRQLGFLVFCGICALLFIALNALMLTLLNTKGRRLFAALS